MPDVRLIDANALTEYFKRLERSLANARCFSAADAVRGAAEKVASAPAIDAVPVVHARWVYEQRYGDSGSWVWRCSACRKEAVSPTISALKYCHICGAKMDGGAE